LQYLRSEHHCKSVGGIEYIGYGKILRRNPAEPLALLHSQKCDAVDWPVSAPIEHRRGVWRDRKWLYPGSIGMEKNVEEFWHRVVSDRKHPHGTTSVIQEGT
jgi:hypothetical protein